MKAQELGTLVHGQPNEALVNCIQEDNDSEPSHYLRRLALQFSQSCHGEFQVVAFFERIESPTIQVRLHRNFGTLRLIISLKLAQDGTWQKNGPLRMLVREQSATGTGLAVAAHELNIPLNTNHSGLVKFESRNQGDYELVAERIRQFVFQARRDVPNRFKTHSEL